MYSFQIYVHILVCFIFISVEVLMAAKGDKKKSANRNTGDAINQKVMVFGVVKSYSLLPMFFEYLDLEILELLIRLFL